MEAITLVPLDLLHESPFNPRKTFSEAGLQELSIDIKSQGIVSPLLVRPRLPNILRTDHDASDGYELVFGHRRLRAARLAELDAVPVMVRAMTDEEAKRAQISENLSREDVHPVEEAEGYRALIEFHGHTADQLAEKFGKSRSYIYGRLKLLQGCKEVREDCLAGKIGSEVALLLARLRTEKLQRQALGYIKGKFYSLEDGGQKSFRQIRDLLNERFTLELKEAIFDHTDAQLLPASGSCTECPKRTGNAPEFEDVAFCKQERGPYDYSMRHRGADVCTDPDCFAEKKRAHLKVKATEMIASGKIVIEGTKARQAIDACGNVKGAFVSLKEVKAELKAVKGEKPAVFIIQDPRTGKTVEAVKVVELQAAGVKTKEPKKVRSNGQSDESYEKQRAREAEKAKAETTVRMAILQRVREAAAQAERSAFDLQLIAQAAFSGVGYEDRHTLAKLHGHDDVEHLRKSIGQMGLSTLTLFVLDCALVDYVEVEPWRMHHKPEPLLAAAKHYGVDVDAIRAELAPAKPASTPSKAARAKGRAKGAGTVKKAPPAEADAEAIDGAARSEEEQKDEAGFAGELVDGLSDVDELEEARP